ncbi:MAG: isochorismatase family protein [Gammaproteobacteria bacterium]|nr:MAG: isochorismatase family protein [Gammaproteobacteria bacterium]
MTPLARCEDSLLVSIDVQDRLVAAIPEKPRRQAVTASLRLVRVARMLEVPVVFTRQYPKGLGEIHPPLAEHASDTPVDKTCFSCCGEQDFLEQVLGSHRRQIILTGMETHICVLQTALELQREGLEVHVVEDAVCSRHKKHHKNALHRLRQAGIIVSNHESVLFEWLRDAGHERFREISAMLREDGD